MRHYHIFLSVLAILDQFGIIDDYMDLTQLLQIMSDKSTILIIPNACGSIILFLDFIDFSGIYCYFSAIYVINRDLLNSRENMIFADNSCGVSVSFTTIITTSRPTFITGASSSDVLGARYTGPKPRRDSPESGTHKNEIL